MHGPQKVPDFGVQADRVLPQAGPLEFKKHAHPGAPATASGQGS